MAGIWLGSEKRTVVPRWAETKLSATANSAISRTPTSSPRSLLRPTPAASAISAAASTVALYAGLLVERTMKMDVADQAATARAFKTCQLCVGIGGGAG